jgi:hypothetical protein
MHFEAGESKHTVAVLLFGSNKRDGVWRAYYCSNCRHVCEHHNTTPNQCMSKRTISGFMISLGTREYVPTTTRDSAAGEKINATAIIIIICCSKDLENLIGRQPASFKDGLLDGEQEKAQRPGKTFAPKPRDCSAVLSLSQLNMKKRTGRQQAMKCKLQYIFPFK